VKLSAELQSADDGEAIAHLRIAPNAGSMKFMQLNG
jgi:hypothetical protein